MNYSGNDCGEKRGECFSHIMRMLDWGKCCKLQFLVAIFGSQWTHKQIVRMRIAPRLYAHIQAQRPLPPSAVPDPVIPRIMHLTEQQHAGRTQRPRVLKSPTLRAKENRGRDRGRGRWKVSQVMRCMEASSLLTVTGNQLKHTHTHTHTHTYTHCYQFFCSPMREWEEEKEGSDKEREGEREGARERWEGVCVWERERERETVSQSRRGRRRGGMEGAVWGRDSLSSWMLSFLFMALSLLCTVTLCPQEQAPLHRPALCHGAGDESAPTKSLWDGSVCFCLEGGTHQAFPGKRQPAVCVRLRASSPRRCVYERGSVHVRVWVHACVWMWVSGR